MRGVSWSMCSPTESVERGEPQPLPQSNTRDVSLGGRRRRPFSETIASAKNCVDRRRLLHEPGHLWDGAGSHFSHDLRTYLGALT
jgi:hypothetical protein